MAKGPRGAFTLVVLAACAAGALAGLTTGAKPTGEIEMSARNLVRVSGGQMVLVLAEKNGARRLGVPVTGAEAALIQGALLGARGLSATTIRALGGRVRSASIDDALSLRDFRAHLVVESGARELRLEASAGEALSLALQAGAAIYADPALLDAAGVSPEELRGKRARDVRSGSPPAPAQGI